MPAPEASSSGATPASACRTFADTSRSPGQARSFVRSVLREWDLDAVEETALLLVSELATNVVLHARTEFDVVVQQHEGGVRLLVLDDAPQGPVRRHTGLRSATGRGLALVESMSADWGRADGHDLQGRAKGIWCDVPLVAEAQLDEGAIYGTDWLAMLDEPLS